MLNGGIQDPNEMVSLLKQLPKEVRGGLSQDMQVNIGLPEHHSFVATLATTETNKDAIMSQAETVLPFGSEEIYFESEHVKGQSVVAIAAGRKKYIDGYLEVLEAANIKPVGLYVETVAISEVLLRSQQLSGAAVVLDIGSARTTVAISVNHAICFTTSYPPVFTQDNFNQAALVGLLNQVVSYYSTHHADLPAIEKIVLCGSGSYISGIAELVMQNSQIQTEYGNPLTTFKRNSLLKKMQNPLAYTTAIGLALMR